MTKYFAIAGSLVLCLTTVKTGKAEAADSTLAGFNVSEIRFDESMGDKKPLPVIPKGWRFIGVSNGEKMNSNNLWFQDQVGNIYLVQGFTSGNEFTLRPEIGKLSIGK